MYLDRLALATPETQIMIKGEIQTNYAMAEVFFQTLNVLSIVQTPMFDVSSFESFYALLSVLL